MCWCQGLIFPCQMSTAGWAPWATHLKLSKTEERVCRLIAPAPEPGPGAQATGGSATRGSERRGRKTNSSSSCLGTLCKGSNPEKSGCVSSSAHWLNSRHVVGRQRAAMGVEQEDQLHQDRRGVGLLGSKVEHRHDVALIVTAHRESDPGGQRALVREDHVTEEERAHFQSCNPPLGIPILECPRVLLHVDLLVEPVHLLLFRLHFVGAPSSHKCQSFVQGASIAATPPRGLRQVRGVLDEGRVEEEPQHERQHPDHLGGFPHRGGGHQAQSGWSIDFASGHAAVAHWMRPRAFSMSFECIACPSTMVCKTSITAGCSGGPRSPATC